MSTIAYVDADILCHRAIHGAATEIDEGEYLVSHHGIKDSLIEGVNAWVAPLKVAKVIPVLSDYHHNWRYALGGPYKLNRSGGGVGTSADLMKFARQFVRDQWPHFMQIEGLEADDTIGIAVTHPDHAKRSIAVSIDKDFMTLPARVFNPMGKGKRAIPVNKSIADYNWMLQTLTGDTVDNYKGCPGIGPVKAEKILQPHVGDIWGMWGAVVETFLENDLTYDEALLNARYARILRHEDWSATKGVRLFTGNKRKPEWLSINLETMKRPTKEGDNEQQTDKGVPRNVRRSGGQKPRATKPRRKAASDHSAS